MNLPDRIKWRALDATKQSGIRCTDPVFWAYLREERGYDYVEDEIGAVVAVRGICGVASRALLTKPGHAAARARWVALDRDYQSWKAVEHG